MMRFMPPMQLPYQELFKEILLLREENRTLKEQVAVLIAKVADLQARLDQNSKNSSKSPSTDQKGNASPNPEGNRRKGATHPGASRKLLPESQVTSREIRKEDSCPRCRSKMEPTGEVNKWQQVEMPPIQPIVHQIELHTCRCSKCGLVKTPELTEQEKMLLGPRLEAFITLCLGQLRQGDRMVRSFIAALIPDLKLSSGLISKIKARAAKALQPADEQIAAAIDASEDPTHADATGWRFNNQNGHALIVRVGNLIRFIFSPVQNQQIVGDLLKGKRVLHLVSDRGFPAGQLKCKTHQYCLAHLLRNIQGLAEHGGINFKDTQTLGEIHEGIQSLFHDQHRMQRGEISEHTWRQYGYQAWAILREKVGNLVETTASPKVRRFTKRLMRDWSYFMVYLRSRDHPMTNNPAEEGLRGLVIARKLCFGSRSLYGRKWRAYVHGIIETVRRHGRSVWDFLTEALRSARFGSPYPLVIV